MYILNLTTIRGRLDLCSATIWSLLQQEFTPDQINIWISRDPYMADEGIIETPEWVTQFNNIKDIIKVHYVRNTGPYRKIIPALQSANESDILIYADDDVIYAKHWLKKLIHCYHQNNDKFVVAARIKPRKKNIFGQFQSYNMLDICHQQQKTDRDFIITGVGGCVLAKKHINPQLLALEDYLSLAPRTDDLWISKIIELSGTSAFSCPEALIEVQEIVHGNNALSHTNTLVTKGGILHKIYQKTHQKIAGYLGAPLSNNDKSMKKIEAFFSK